MTSKAITGAIIINTVELQPDPQPGTILIDDGRIQRLARPGEPITADEIFETAGAWVIPGLIDLHFDPFRIGEQPGFPPVRCSVAELVHRGQQALKVWVESGVTAARTPGAHENLDLALRDVLNAGEIPGPRLFASGKPIAAFAGGELTRTYGWVEVSGPDEARRAARQAIKNGADHLVIYPDRHLGGRHLGGDGWLDKFGEPAMTEKTLGAITETARHAGVGCHAVTGSAESIQRCVRANLYSVEHVTNLDDESADWLRESRTALVTAPAGPWSVATRGAGRGIAAEAVGHAAARLATIREQIASAQRAGLPVAPGTDARDRHALPRETCRLLAEAGLTPYAALRSATKIAAEVLRRGWELGSIEPGRRADLILLDKDPLADIRNLASVRGVLLAGEIVFWRKEVTDDYG